MIDPQIEQTFTEMVLQLAKPGRHILESMTSIDAHRTHMAMGVAGEAGELLDIIKKNVIYGKEVPLLHLIEELGDIEFFLCGIRESFGISREEVLAANMQKLGVRYKNFEYSDEAANTRKDKNA